MNHPVNPTSTSNITRHDFNDLITIFEQLFKASQQTVLVKGGDEPIYLPQDDEHSHHRVIFARGFYASALHEISHWLVAGSARRLLEDFGYWYCPDGRDQAKQLEFEAVEVKPQAIEWALCLACGVEFNVSSDNLNGWQSDRFVFQDKVYSRLCDLISGGFNTRTIELIEALQTFYQTAPITISSIGYTPHANHQQASHEV